MKESSLDAWVVPDCGGLRSLLGDWPVLRWCVDLIYGASSYQVAEGTRKWYSNVGGLFCSESESQTVSGLTQYLGDVKNGFFPMLDIKNNP